MNRLKYNIVYGSGQMDHCRESGKGWRKEIGSWLNKELNCMFIDPYEKPVLHRDYSVIEDDKAFQARKEAIQAGNYKEARKLTKEMVSFDMRAVDKSDFLICYLNFNFRMCGTWDEVYRAADQRKPVLFMCEQGVSEMPPWLFGRFPTELFFESWNDLKSYLWTIDKAENFDTIDTLGNRWKFFDYDTLFGQVANVKT